MIEVLRTTVAELLKRSNDPALWSAKGLGMMRLNMPNRTRLHLWHNHFLWADTALKHTHPWGLHSNVVCGRLKNNRFIHCSPGVGRLHHVKRVECGPKGMEQIQLEDVHLGAASYETYHNGSYYGQSAAEIHESRAENGTVSIMRKFGPDSGRALVYYEKEWADAYERAPTYPELADAIDAALGLLDPTAERVSA